jgi:adenine-specific DNA-methyltransferase
MKKKYGLLWEDKPEDVKERRRENLPVLKEVQSRFTVDKSTKILAIGTFNERIEIR